MRETFQVTADMLILKNRLLALLPLLALAVVPACASDTAPSTPPAAPTTGAEQEVVDVPNTKVSGQSIGNCWIYATAGWAESLRLGYAGESLNISESYLSYIDWFHGIQAGDIEEKDGLQTGGWFGEAAEYLHAFGVMDEGAFIPEEAQVEKSARQSKALAAINASIKTGDLSTPAARRDPIKVRDALDKAFELSPEVIALLDQSFGHDLSRSTERATIPAGKGLRPASAVPVGTFKPKGAAAREITLDDATGKPSSADNIRSRVGQFAWNETSYPYSASGQRPFFRQMQKALHGRRPVILVWFVDFNAMDRSTAIFADIPATPGRQGGHMTVMEDYQVSNVPDFGTLAAGTVVTDPKALEAALDDRAVIDFIRVKNSWGSGFAPPAGSELRGYHDLYNKYLTGMIPRCDKKDAAGKCVPQSPQRGLTSLVLPPASWDEVGLAETEPTPEPGSSCAHAVCETGAKLEAGCDSCVEKVCEKDPYCCNTQWDGVCKTAVGSICEQACKLTLGAVEPARLAGSVGGGLGLRRVWPAGREQRLGVVHVRGAQTPPPRPWLGFRGGSQERESSRLSANALLLRLARGGGPPGFRGGLKSSWDNDWPVGARPGVEEAVSKPCGARMGRRAACPRVKTRGQ